MIALIMRTKQTIINCMQHENISTNDKLLFTILHVCKQVIYLHDKLKKQYYLNNIINAHYHANNLHTKKQL